MLIPYINLMIKLIKKNTPIDGKTKEVVQMLNTVYI